MAVNTWFGRMAGVGFLIATVGLCAAGQETPFLIKDGASAYAIVVAESASASEKQAAQEFREAFLACTGVDLPVVAEAPASEAPMIVLGCGPVAKQLGVDPTVDSLGEQGYVLRAVPPHLVIAGTPMAGTLYGVFDFLDEYLGARWYAPGVTEMPEVKDLPLPEVDRLVKPAFLWRHTSYAWPGGDEAFRARQRDNAGSAGADNPYGVQHEHDGRCHSYFRFISPSEFFESHPEYFSEIGGVRRSVDTQLCLTNPDVLEIVTERMLKRMAEQPNVRQHNFSQMDYYHPCECPACRAMNEQYGSLGGTQFWFVNQLAERTAKVYPDKCIGTLAYMYTEEPPKDVKMHPNVAVWLCHMFPSCDSHPIESCPLNADYKRRARAWSQICSHLYIWHYIVDFAHYYNPFPNFHAMAADMKFYRDIGVEGIYLQGMGHGGGGGEFSLLRPYYGMKLLWNPDRDADALLCDFLEGYYGAAWKPIHEYITMLQDKVQNENIHMHLYTNPAQGYLPDEVLDRAAALFEKAEEAVAGDEEMAERVRVARMPLTYARIFPRNGLTIENETFRFNGPFAPMSEVLDMFKRMEAHGFQSVREVMGDPRTLGVFAAAFSSPIPAPRLESQYLTVDAVPLLGGRMLRLIHRPSGQCVTAYGVDRYLIYPFGGGEETRWGGIFQPTGFYDQYVVAEKGERILRLSTTSNGFQVERTLELAEDAPIVTITATVKNADQNPREIGLRSHLELDLGDLLDTRVAFTNRGGQDVSKDMRPIVAGLREGEHYYDRDAPNGVWTFSGTKGLEVTQRFDEATTDFTWLYAYPDYLNDLEAEIWRKPVVLAPGESVTLQHELEVRMAGF